MEHRISTALRKFRGASYEIEYHNTGDNKVKLMVDGAGIEGNVAPPAHFLAGEDILEFDTEAGKTYRLERSL